MGVRSFLTKCFFQSVGFLFHAGTRCHANEAAGSGRSTSAKGKIKKGPVKSTELSSMPPPEPIPAIISGVDSVSPSSQEVSETVIPASSSHRQGAEMRRVKRIRSGKRKIRDCEAGCDRAEAEAHLGSPSFHHSGMSSDDLFGGDEIESVQITIAQLYGWSSSGGFAEATCLEAEPGRGQLRITEDLVGGPHGGIVHFCATDAKVCKAGWPGRRVIISTFGGKSFTITGNGSVAQKGVKNHEVVSVVPPAAQANILEEDVDSPGPGPQPVSGKPTA